MKVLFASLLVAFSLAAQERMPRIVPFKLLSAEVQSARLPDLGVKPQRRYERALVIRISADQKSYDALPPDIAAYLYLGNHELHPFSIERPKEGNVVVITFNDPDWQSITAPVPMVLTTRHQDPVRNPEKYREFPKFDPKMVK